MNEKKVTKKEMYELIAKTLADNAEVVEFCNHEIELLSRKSVNADGTKKLTSAQKKNIELITAIIAKMEKGTIYTIGDMQKKIDICADLTNQKMRALLTLGIDSGEVKRTEEKGKVFFERVV